MKSAILAAMILRICFVLVFVVAVLAAPGLAALRIPAEEATVRTGGEKIPATSPKGEKGWFFHTRGTLGAYVAVSQAGQYTIVVRACGDEFKGAWPQMAVKIDDLLLVDETADQPAFSDISYPAKLTPGVHSLTVTFFNQGPADGTRNLYLSRLEIIPPAGADEPKLSSVGEWSEQCRQKLKDEERLLAAADQSIEQKRKGDGTVRVVDASGKPLQGAKVEIDQVRHEFLFGCNIFGFDSFKTAEENALYKQRFADLFNFATLPFYWKSYEPQEGRPQYAGTDTIVAWCKEHHIRMKGHPLLWAHEAGIPTWAKGRQPPVDVQKKRVTDIIGRYGRDIEFWEVVNEPSQLYQYPIAIDEPYRWARQADPKAYLIVNDSHQLAGNPRFYQILQKAMADGVPFNGIGLQAHNPETMRFPMERVKAVLEQYAALGKDLYITEFTPVSSGEPMLGLAAPGPWDEKAQADYAVKLYRTCFAHPAVLGITWWDLCDTGSWQKGGGMLHEDLSPKIVYTALHKLIQEEWHSRAAGQTGADGSYRFRGFFGQYQVKVTVDGKTVTGDFQLERKPKDGKRLDWTIRVAESK
jgi:GH35 family endo-1,4-beta-xylanase